MLKNSVLWVILPLFEISCADKYRYHLPLLLRSDFASNQERLILCSISKAANDFLNPGIIISLAVSSR